MQKMRDAMTAAMSLMLVLSLAACAGTPATTATDSPERYTEQAPATDPVADPAGDSAVESDSSSGSDLDRIGKDQEQDAEAVETDPIADASETESGTDMSSVESIVEIGKLVGTWQQLKYSDFDNVDIHDEHNPYDLVWQYGDPETEKRDEFGTLYASYVDAADWSLVFDAEYYKKAFPMLAMLYHDDDSLLLEHFQTVGVHEGRQGTNGFNVSVYMDNCGSEFLDAFGDDYECYYFYYMLNQETEHNVPAAGEYGKDPLWLRVELTLMQNRELGSVNRYRERAGAPPMTIDPENIAFANYRAWYNATNSVRGHGWLDDVENPEVDKVFDILGVDHLSENTLTNLGNAGKKSSFGLYAVRYANSEDHYEAMVCPEHLYLGVSHMYYNGDTAWLSQFDTFLYTAPVPDFTMR